MKMIRLNCISKNKCHCTIIDI